MANERKGFIVERDGRLYVRIQWTDNLGRRRELMRRAQDKKHARELKKELVKQLDSADAEQKLAAEENHLQRLSRTVRGGKVNSRCVRRGPQDSGQAQREDAEDLPALFDRKFRQSPSPAYHPQRR